MAQNYRKALGGNLWHFSGACTQWPRRNYIESQNPQQLSELCRECLALRGLARTKCAVVVHGQECGGEFVKQKETPSVAIYECSSRHRTEIPRFHPKKPS